MGGGKDDARGRAGPTAAGGGATVRRGALSDAGACAAILHRCARMFADTAHPEAVEEAPPPLDAFRDAAFVGRLFVAERGGAVIGFLLWEVERDTLHICELDVDPDHQRQGVGRALIAAAAERARMMDRDGLTLTTYDDVPWNAPAYARMGFVPLPRDAWTPECRADLRMMRQAGQDVSRRIAMLLRV